MDWKPNITIEQAFQIWPALQKGLPITCKCGNHLAPKEFIVTEDFINIVSESCSCKDYGRSGYGIFRSKRSKERWLKIAGY